MTHSTADPVEASPYAWQGGLLREMAAVNPHSKDVRFVEVGAAGSEFVPVTELLEPPNLRDIILRSGGLEGHSADGPAIPEMDMTVAVSRLARQYCTAVAAVAVVGLAHGVGIDMSPQRCRVALTNPELPVTRRKFAVAVDLTGAEIVRCADRGTSLPVTGPVVAAVDELRAYVWSRLFGAHFEPLFQRVRELVPTVGAALLWTSAAEYVGLNSDAAEEHLPPQVASRYVADRRALLEGDTLPGVAGPNPMRDLLVWDPAAAAPLGSVQARRMCCLNYLLPDRDGLLCTNCPHLPPEDRVAVENERRTLPSGSAFGPAQRRAQELGRSRPSYRQRHRMAAHGELANKERFAG